MKGTSIAICCAGSLLSLIACILLDAHVAGPRVSEWLQGVAVCAPLTAFVTTFFRFMVEHP